MKLVNQKDFLIKVKIHQKDAIRASCVKSFCDREFVTKYMLDVVDQVSPEHRKMFEFFSHALNESTNIDDSAQWFISLKGISENLEITQELLPMESMKDTTTRDGIFEWVENSLYK
ncbi:hypothetical protein RF11_07257 [Thelohanellus kitauei]|uniref:Uncharacterized protein n=1 Tax=Thelohanellus kitauei TaxID=669202 RepID=A0A0C2N703_THEKT|nr:hypothetical protein RF11_07257 [Thelohanellus kitauei]